MIMKKTLSLLLAVIMITMTFTVFPITANAVDVDAAGTAVDKTFTINNAGDLSDALTEINAVTKSTTYAINLQTDLENCEIGIKNGNAEVTVIGNGKTISATQSAVYVSEGAKVILGDGNSELTLTSADNNDTAGIVHVLKNSSCTMKNQVTLRDHNGQNYLGGGVTVDGGTFVMDGGTITNCSIAGTKQDDNGGSVCYGGGVAVFNSGTFTMNNGTITECKAKTDYPVQDYSRQYAAMGGGVFVSAGSTFTMNNGTISKCEATNLGGGVAVVNHDKPTNGQLTSKVEINGGIISGNEALGGAGVFASGFVYAYAIPIATGAEVNGIASTGYSNATNALLGAAPSDPGLYIKGGTITDNKATGTYSNDDDNENSSYLFAKGIGGGVLVYGVGTPVQIHNAVISSNHADHGAGVASFYYWTNADIDGCTITGNIAKGNGGGVYLANKITKKDENTYYLPKATIKDTTITGNSSGDRGAGVYYIADTELHISGRDVIQNNTFNGTLNNLNVLIGKKSTTGSQEELLPVYVDGALSGSKIGLSDPRLWEDDKEDAAPDAVSADKLTSGYRATNPEVHPSEYFTSDHETWIVERSAKTTTEVIDTTSKPRYQFTAKRYSVIDKGRLAGLRNQLVIKDIKNPDLKDSSSLQIDEIVEELKYPYSDTTKYSCEDKSYPSVGSIYLTYRPLVSSSSPFSSIVIKKAPNDQTAMIIYNAANGGSVQYSASTANQSRYANTGELVLEITQTNTINTTFNTDPDTFNGSEDTTVEYLARSLPRNSGNILYDYDENGYITAKYVIEKPSDYTQVQNKIIIEGGEDEVRLIRKKPDYHINNTEIDDKYNNNDIFTSYVEAATKEVKVGDTIGRFYTIPEVVPTSDNSCPYIFKGWYYDQENDNDSHPVQFDTDKYAKDIYAHWIKVDNVTKDENDLSMLQSGEITYGGFDLAGVQIRRSMLDTNFGKITPGGMRFITSLSMDVVYEINKIKPNNIEYGYVAAKDDGTSKDWIDYHDGYEKLQYVSDGANGINTTNTTDKDKDYFGFAHNVDCTSRVANSSSTIVPLDHQNYNGYLLYSLVINYDEENPTGYDTKVLARPYIHYTDANNLDRVAYSEYLGNANKIGGCYISYNDIVAKSGN